MSIVVTGATGFIGRHLTKYLIERGETVKALTRRPPPAGSLTPGIQWVIGDVNDKCAWERLLEPDCVVINLAYSVFSVEPDAVQSVERMVEYCASYRISRLVHCSTVSVYGQVSDELVTESTECNPKSTYGKIKLEIEKALVAKISGRFDCTILRPSSVLGQGGLTLDKEIRALLSGSSFLNYLRESIFGFRQVHIVPVETVVAALFYISRVPLKQSIELFIISEDETPVNNYRNVMQLLKRELHITDFPIRPLAIPRWLLEFLLSVLRRPNTNTRTIYSSKKLKSLGFSSPISLDEALRHYAINSRPDRKIEVL